MKKITSLKNLRKVLVSSSIAVVLLMFFQNCGDVGLSSSSYSDLDSTDPHKDSWRPVDGLVVRDGEWVAIEEKVVEQPRNMDRYFIASVLYRAFLPTNESLWTNGPNAAVRNIIDSYVHGAANYSNFGGPCFYVNPEARVGNTATNCNGRSASMSELSVSPGGNVFRSVLKFRLCDKLLQNDKALSNFTANIETLKTALSITDDLQAAHQLFYLGAPARKRTVASLSEMVQSVNRAGEPAGEDFRHIGLALCTSNGWEIP